MVLVMASVVAGVLKAGPLIGLYIVVETPLSGMSLNPARSLGTAVAAGRYPALWLYFVGPVAATWLGAVLFKRYHKGEPLACAIIAGCDTRPPTGPYAAEKPHYPDSQADQA